MRWIGLSGLAIVVLFANGFSQPDTLWTKTYGDQFNDWGYSVCETTDGGYFITGISYQVTSTNADIITIKTDSLGNAGWTTMIGNEHTDWGHCGLQTADGGYVVTGLYEGNSSDAAICLIKFDAGGDTVWMKLFGEGYGCSVRETDDGKLVVTGKSSLYDQGVFLYVTDAEGDSIMYREYGEYQDEGLCVQHTSDGGYLMCGNTHRNAETYYDVLLIKTDAVGDTIWTTTCGGPFNDYGKYVIEDADGNYVVTGTWDGELHGDNYGDAFLMKVDVDGDTLWKRTYGGEYNDWGNCVQEISAGGYIIAGLCNAYYLGMQGDLYLVRTDADGAILWTQTLDGGGSDGARSVRQTADGGFIVAGTMAASPYVPGDIWLLKFDSEGSWVKDWNLFKPADFQLHAAYPNPFNSRTVISFTLRKPGNVTLNLYDITGAHIRNIATGFFLPGNYDVNFDASGFASGLYFIDLRAQEQFRSRPLVLLK
jgi:hypothetical protein